MAGSLSISIADLASANVGETRASERAELVNILLTIGQQIGSGAATSGTIRDRMGTSLGTWTWTPKAAT